MDTNNPNPPVSPVEQQSISHPLNNQRGFFPIILGVLVLLIVVGGGAYYLGSQNSRTAPQTENTNTQPTTNLQNNSISNPTSVPITTQNAPDDWRTYTNDQLGYTINYPSNYTVSKPNSSETIGITFSYGNKNSFRVETYVGEHLNDYYKTSHAWWLNEYQKNVSNIVVDGISGKKFIYEAQGDTGNVYEMVLVEKNGKAYEFWAETRANDDEGMDTFRTAISTFKFTN